MERFLSYVLISLFILGCNNSKLQLTQEVFEFEVEKILEKNRSTNMLSTGWYHISDDSISHFERVSPIDNEIYQINPKPVILPINFKKKKTFTNDLGEKGVGIHFDKVGKYEWMKATELAIFSHLVFILNDQIIVSPKVNAKMTNGVSAFFKESMTEEQFNEIMELTKD